MTTRWRLPVLVAAGLAVAVVVAVALAPIASSEPDGLERVAIDEGFADAAEEHALADLPTADYGVRGVDGAAGTALAGVAGIAVTFVVMAGVVLAARGRRRPPGAAPG